VGRRIQLKYEMPWVGVASGTATRSGAGNSVAGVKCGSSARKGRRRLVGYRSSSFNTDQAPSPRASSSGPQLLLPTEITLEVRRRDNGELGRTSWSTATTLGLRHLDGGRRQRRLELLAELHGERRGAEPTELIVNVGDGRSSADGSS